MPPKPSISCTQLVVHSFAQRLTLVFAQLEVADDTDVLQLGHSIGVGLRCRDAQHDASIRERKVSIGRYRRQIDHAEPVGRGGQWWLRRGLAPPAKTKGELKANSPAWVDAKAGGNGGGRPAKNSKLYHRKRRAVFLGRVGVVYSRLQGGQRRTARRIGSMFQSQEDRTLLQSSATAVSIILEGILTGTHRPGKRGAQHHFRSRALNNRDCSSSPCRAQTCRVTPNQRAYGQQPLWELVLSRSPRPIRPCAKSVESPPSTIGGPDGRRDTNVLTRH